MSALTDWALASPNSVFTLPIVVVMVLIDGVFPPIPGETVVIALASLAAAGKTGLWLVLPAATLGAFLGDLLAYHLGRWVPVHRLRTLNRGTGAAIFQRTQRALDSHGSSYILAARFIPIGRVIVNMTAGVMRFPRARYLPTAALASLLWALSQVGIGYGAGALLKQYPFAGVVIGVVGGILVGVILDKTMGAIARRRFAKLNKPD